MKANTAQTIIFVGWLAFTFACMYFFSNWFVLLILGLTLNAEYKR